MEVPVQVSMFSSEKQSFKPVVFPALAIFLLSTWSGFVSAKTRGEQPYHRILISNAQTVQSVARQMEKQLAPFFEAKLTGTGEKHSVPPAIPPADIDMMMLCKVWDNLSPQFKKMYLQATAIPDDFKSVVSTGGHFEIFYTLEGSNAVDSTDTGGIGNDHDRHARSNIANGIPDYIDEVAWALDSSWSMEVERFGFIDPIPVRDSRYPSGRYKVVVTDQRDQGYGMTYPQGKLPGTQKGFSSYVEITNAWPSSLWAEFGYDKHPEYGVRVTCAHEFLHAIHYAMTWSLNENDHLDDYPVSWLEGTAVLMEELAFDSINDYLQYATSYFYQPTMSFFDQSTGFIIYTSSLLTKFLFERATGSPRIDFIKRVFERNYERTLPFDDNLRRTSAEFGTTWVRILNDFHTESYFTGVRTEGDRFLADSRLYPSWSYPLEPPVTSTEKTVTVKPYGMAVFGMTPVEGDVDTLRLTFTGEIDPADTVRDRWAVSYIIRKQSSADSVVSLDINDSGSGALALPRWNGVAELIVTTSNGSHTSPGVARFALLKKQPAVKDIETYPNPVSLHSGEAVRMRGPDISEVRIYGIDGNLICTDAEGTSARAIVKSGNVFLWRLTNNAGKKVVPGIYMAIITGKNPDTAESTAHRRKILVAP